MHYNHEINPTVKPEQTIQPSIKRGPRTQSLIDPQKQESLPLLSPTKSSIPSPVNLSLYETLHSAQSKPS